MELGQTRQELGKINEHIKIKNVLKYAATILCMIGFVANSFMIFKQFIEHKTITSQDVQKNAYLFLPSVTICGLSGFKDKMDEYDDLELDNYHQKTLDLEEILIGITYPHGHSIILQEMYKNAMLWKITTTYSPFKGRCHTINYGQEVKILIFPEINLNLFIHKKQIM